jgi:hypothetical protein
MSNHYQTSASHRQNGTRCTLTFYRLWPLRSVVAGAAGMRFSGIKFEGLVKCPRRELQTKSDESSTQDGLKILISFYAMNIPSF